MKSDDVAGRPALPADLPDQLAQEVVESQKVRSDFIKWKIVIVAALFGAGLGIVNTSTSGQRYADLVLCAIPVLNTYVDALCRHLSLRITVIGEFRRSHYPNHAYQLYENFIAAARRAGVLVLEGWAIFGMSVTCSIALLLLPLAVEPPLPHDSEIQISGALGLALATSVELRFRLVKRRIFRLADDVAARRSE